MTADLIAADRQDRLRVVTEPSDDDALFEALYAEHFDRLRRFVLGLTGQGTLAEDVAQETLLRAYLRMDTMDFDRPLWPWLKCVAVRLVVDSKRALRRESLDPEPALEPSTDTFDTTVERQLLIDALRGLPVRHQVVLGLRYVEEWKSAEVGAVLGLSRVAVEQLLLRARRRLSAEYLALGGESTGWRVVLWPVVYVLSRIRDRSAKLRQVLNGGGVAQLPMTVEGATNMVAAVAMGSILLAGGAALAASAAADAPRRVEAVHASAFHAVEVRAEATPASATEAITERSADATRKATPRSQKARAVTSSAPATAPRAARVTKVRVGAPAAIKQAPAAPLASATGTRTQEKALLRGKASVRVGDRAPVASAELHVPCSSGTVTRTGCAAYDTVESDPRLP